ncbi:MAG: hypothetical protein ACLTEG_02685 [Acutalibacter sp.]
MKMLKTYWLELLFSPWACGRGLRMPIPAGSIPAVEQRAVVATMPKARSHPRAAAGVLSVPLVDWRCLEKLPALAPTFSGMERLLPAVLAVVCLSLEGCIMLAAWGVAVKIAVVLLVELLVVPIVFIGFVAAKILGNIGKIK